MWGGAHKELFDSGRVSFQAQDFFEPQPQALQVPGAGAVAHPAVYLVTRVLHNWPDADCIKYASGRAKCPLLSGAHGIRPTPVASQKAFISRSSSRYSRL